MLSVERLENRRLFAAFVHQELHRPPIAMRDLNGDGLADLVVVTAQVRRNDNVDAGGDGNGNGGHAGGGGGGAAGRSLLFGFDVYLNAGDNSFRFGGGTDCNDTDAVAADIAIGDLTGDGVPDVALKLYSVTGQLTPAREAITSKVVLFGGSGKGDFTQRESFVLPHVLDTSDSRRSLVPKQVIERSGMAVGDVDGDGAADLVSWQDDQVITVMSDARGGPRQTTSQDGTFSHGTIRGNARVVGLGDLDADGDMDLVAYDEDAPTVLVRGWDPKEKKPIIGGTVDPSPATRNGRIDGILIGDLDGDGFTDDLALLSGKRLTVGINQTKPDPAGGEPVYSFSWGETRNLAGVRPADVRVVDLDGDGVDDLFALRWQRNGIGHVTLIK